MTIEFFRSIIPTAELVESLKAGEDGAVVVFDGIVRNNTRGRKTLFLDYESYEQMALDQMRALATEAIQKFGVRDIALVHRLGRLDHGVLRLVRRGARAHERRSPQQSGGRRLESMRLVVVVESDSFRKR